MGLLLDFIPSIAQLFLLQKETIIIEISQLILIICFHHVSLNYFAVFVHHEGGFFVADGGAAAEPAAGMATAGPFCGL